MTDDAATPAPRTAAGRALLGDLDMSFASGMTGPTWNQLLRPKVEESILAIEAEARPAVASEGLRAALERLIDEYQPTKAGWSYWHQVFRDMIERAALASDAGHSVGALDVERLALALHQERSDRWGGCGNPGEAYDDHMTFHQTRAERVAAAYDAERQGE